MQQSDFQRDTELPVLKIVPTANLVVHEFTDEQRILALLPRLERDGLLKNPPIVAPIAGSHESCELGLDTIRHQRFSGAAQPPGRTPHVGRHRLILMGDWRDSLRSHVRKNGRDTSADRGVELKMNTDLPRWICFAT